MLRSTARDIATADGERIVAWSAPASCGKPLFLYFHGNGGSLADRADALRRFASDGSGFLAIDYRGYGGSTGAPSETGFLRDGEAAFREATALGYGAERIVVVGESIGTGVAVAVAAGHAVRALVLDSAFSSATDVAAARFPMFPVRLLMSDRFDSAARIAGARMPKLFLHGTGDPVIPLAFGRRLFAAAPQPKTIIELKRNGHVMLFAPDVPGTVRRWLAALPPPVEEHPATREAPRY